MGRDRVMDIPAAKTDRARLDWLLTALTLEPHRHELRPQLRTLTESVSPPYTGCVVQADVANLRSAPRMDAPIVYYLPINSAWGVLGQQGPWYKVVGGWLHKSVCGDRSLMPQAVQDALAAASTPAARIQWLRRWVAIEPNNRVAWQRLQAALTETKQTAAAQAIGDHLGGRMYVAQCERGVLRLLGVVERNGRFRSLMWTALRPDPSNEFVLKALPKKLAAVAKRRRRAVEPLKSHLAKARWFAWGRGQGRTTVFPGNAYEWPPPELAANNTALGQQGLYTQGLALGRCKGPTGTVWQLFATAPAAMVEGRGCKTDVAADLIVKESRSRFPETFDRLRLMQATCNGYPEDGLTDINAQFYGKYPWYIRSIVVRGTSVWRADNRLGANGKTFPWYRSAWQPKRIMSVVGFVDGGDTYGDDFVVVDDKSVQVGTIRALATGH